MIPLDSLRNREAAPAVLRANPQLHSSCDSHWIPARNAPATRSAEISVVGGIQNVSLHHLLSLCRRPRAGLCRGLRGQRAAQVAFQGAVPYSQNAYKIPLGMQAIVRDLMTVTA